MTKHYAEVTHGKQTILGTDWPISSYVEKLGRGRWLATFNLCNGVPTSTRIYPTLREAEWAIGAERRESNKEM